MKKNNFLSGLFIIIFFNSLFSGTFAQSDYEIVQNFKNNVQQIEEAIKNSVSIDELNEASAHIDKLREDFNKHKTLLDKSLYPDKFKSSIDKLQLSYSLRKDDFTTIDVLQTEVTGLKEEVDALTEINNKLLSQFQTLETQNKKDRTRIAQLEKNVSELKQSLQKRDELVINMIDNLMPSSFRNKEELSAAEKQEVYSEAQKTDVVSNIKRALDDNIRFLEATALKPDDIKEIKEQQKEFARSWINVGIKLVDAYSAKGKNTSDLREIDSAFTEWHDAIDQEIWDSINDIFSLYNISLSKFTDGESFTQSLTSYIDDEIKSDGAENSYEVFADTVWYGIVKPEWMPYLIENNMLSEAERDTIESKISEWKDEDSPAPAFNWLYILLAILIIGIVLLIMLLFKRKTPKESKLRSDEDSA